SGRLIRPPPASKLKEGLCGLLALERRAITMSSQRMLPAISSVLLPVLLGGTLLFSPVLMLAGTPAALPRQESVADAARRTQAEKKLNKKSAVVVTNDTLDTIKGTISVVGPDPAPSVDTAKAAADRVKA